MPRNRKSLPPDRVGSANGLILNGLRRGWWGAADVRKVANLSEYIV